MPRMRLKARRAAHLTILSLAVLAAAPACVPPSNQPHVTLIGDSTMAAMVWYDNSGTTHSQNVLRTKYSVNIQAESCRRLTAPSCRGRFGYAPSNTLDVLRAYRGRLGEAVVIMAGYDDVNIGDAIGQIMAETRAQGVKHVIWLTFPLNVPYVLPGGFPARNLYAQHNTALYLWSLNQPTMHLADWNNYSRGHPEWFGRDGIHLTPAGTMALASFIKAQLDQYVKPVPPPKPAKPATPPTTAKATTTTAPATTTSTTTTSTTTTSTVPDSTTTTTTIV